MMTNVFNTMQQLLQNSHKKHQKLNLKQKIWMEKNKFSIWIKRLKIIAINVLFVGSNKEEIKQYKISKHNSGLKDQVALCITSYGIKWHYPAPKKLSV